MSVNPETQVKALVKLMNSSSLFAAAAEGWNFTIHVRVVGNVVRAPLATFAMEEGGWHCVEIADGTAKVTTTSRDSANFRTRVEFEVQSDTLDEIVKGDTTVGRALLDDRLVAGGVLAHWAATLIHLAQAGDDLRRFLPTAHRKGFLAHPTPP